MATTAHPTGRTTGPTQHVQRAGQLVKRILVVDDSAPMRAILRTMLRSDSSTAWDIAEATSGPELLDAVSSQAPFDIVLLDVQMPEMDGFTACRSLRERDREVPVVFLTAEGDRGSYELGLASGGDSYLVKPFSQSALKTALHVLTSLKRRPETDGAADSLHD